jgi:hypothetical protein
VMAAPPIEVMRIPRYLSPTAARRGRSALRVHRNVLSHVSRPDFHVRWLTSLGTGTVAAPSPHRRRAPMAATCARSAAELGPRAASSRPPRPLPFALSRRCHLDSRYATSPQRQEPPRTHVRATLAGALGQQTRPSAIRRSKRKKEEGRGGGRRSTAGFQKTRPAFEGGRPRGILKGSRGPRAGEPFWNVADEDEVNPAGGLIPLFSRPLFFIRFYSPFSIPACSLALPLPFTPPPQSPRPRPWRESCPPPAPIGSELLTVHGRLAHRSHHITPVRQRSPSPTRRRGTRKEIPLGTSRAGVTEREGVGSGF